MLEFCDVTEAQSRLTSYIPPEQMPREWVMGNFQVRLSLSICDSYIMAIDTIPRMLLHEVKA